MKKFFYMISTVAFMASFASCNKMEQGNTPAEAPSIDGTTTITVSATMPQTKTYLNGGKTFWTKGDIVTLLAEDGVSAVSSNEIPSAVETSDFIFNNWPSAVTPKFIVFNGPLAETEEFHKGNKVMPPVLNADNTITAEVRGVQEIINKFNFSKYANLSIGALEGENGVFATNMKNVCGLIKLQIARDTVEYVKIENLGDAPMTGLVRVDYNNGEPQVVEVLEGNKAVKLTSNIKDTNGKLPKSTYYACVLPGTYSPKITYKPDGGEEVTLTAKSEVTIERNKIMDFGTIDNILTPDPDQPGAGEGGDDTGEPLVITLDFSTSWPFNEELASNVKITEKKTYTLTQNGATYSFDVFSEKGEKGGGFYFNGSALRLTNADNKGTGQRGYLSVPAIAGYKLTALDATVTNGTGTKNLYLYSGCAVNDGIISLSGKLSDAMQIDVAVSKSGHFDITGTSANTSYYLYTESNNYQLGKLVLTYTK